MPSWYFQYELFRMAKMKIIYEVHITLSCQKRKAKRICQIGKTIEYKLINKNLLTCDNIFFIFSHFEIMWFIYIFVREVQLLKLSYVEGPKLYSGLQSNFKGSSTLLKMKSHIKSLEIKRVKIVMRFHQQLNFS